MSTNTPETTPGRQLGLSGIGLAVAAVIVVGLLVYGGRRRRRLLIHRRAGNDRDPARVSLA